MAGATFSCQNMHFWPKESDLAKKQPGQKYIISAKIAIISAKIAIILQNNGYFSRIMVISAEKLLFHQKQCQIAEMPKGGMLVSAFCRNSFCRIIQYLVFILNYTLAFYEETACRNVIRSNTTKILPNALTFYWMHLPQLKENVQIDIFLHTFCTARWEAAMQIDMP